MVHTGRELGLINKHVRQRNENAGEHVWWYQYFPSPSTFDDVYDEGAPGSFGRQYLSPVKVPTIYAEENEDNMVLREDARKPTQTTAFTILLRDAVSAGILSPNEYAPHLNDVLYYDNRYYKVFTYHVRGRLKSEVIIKITCYEVFMDEEFVYDNPVDTINNDSWPTTFPA